MSLPFPRIGGALLLATACLECLAGPPPPEPLRRIYDARSNWRNGTVQFVVAQRDRRPTPRFLDVQFAGPDVLHTDWGDEDGVIARYPDGTPQPRGYAPFYSLQLDGEIWLFGEGNVSAEVLTLKQPPPILDPRALGLAPEYYTGDLREALLLDRSDVEYSVVRKSNLDVVTARSGELERRWYCDASRGGLPVRVVALFSSEVRAEAQITLAEFDGQWYPSSIRYTRKDHKGGSEPIETIDILKVAANIPELPERFSPNDINIDAGVTVSRRDHPTGEADDGLMSWDGERLVPLDEFNEALHDGRATLGPIFQENCARAEELLKLSRATEQRSTAPTSQPSPPGEAVESRRVGAQLSEWEKYTRGFIERYRLDRDQVGRALRVLRRCQDHGQQHLQRHRDEIREYEHRVAALEADASTPGETRARVAELRARLVAPLDEIFEKRLKPGLNELPTPAQRRLVEGRIRGTATSRPANP